MILVTGGAGFIGSNLVRALNRRGHDDVIVVDDMRDGRKFRNLVDCRIADLVDKDDFLASLESPGASLPGVELCFHLGACSDTQEWDGRYMLATNFAYSKALLSVCSARRIAFVYASSAAVYGQGRDFSEVVENEAPLNVYGYSKQLFDAYCRRHAAACNTRVLGLRYFNVYGPRESHKDTMASVVFHFARQVREDPTVRLFRGSGGYADGEQRRDFIHVDDAVAVTLWAGLETDSTGVVNVGTGRSRSFNELAEVFIKNSSANAIEYTDFPERLESAYQHFTEADLDHLRRLGCTHEFMPIETGVPAYLDWIEQHLG